MNAEYGDSAAFNADEHGVVPLDGVPRKLCLGGGEPKTSSILAASSNLQRSFSPGEAKNIPGALAGDGLIVSNWCFTGVLPFRHCKDIFGC